MLARLRLPFPLRVNSLSSAREDIRVNLLKNENHKRFSPFECPFPLPLSFSSDTIPESDIGDVDRPASEGNLLDYK